MPANRKGARRKAIEGNTARRPVKRPVELGPAPAEVQPPAHLGEVARRYWSELYPLLAKVGLLTPADMPAFADMCLCLGRLLEAEAELSAKGMVLQSAYGPRKNPAATLAKEYRQAALAWAKRFGLDPHSRGALDVVPQETKDEMARLLEGAA